MSGYGKEGKEGKKGKEGKEGKEGTGDPEEAGYEKRLKTKG